MPYSGVPEKHWPKLDACVLKVMKGGKHDKSSAIAICRSSMNLSEGASAEATSNEMAEAEKKSRQQLAGRGRLKREEDQEFVASHFASPSDAAQFKELTSKKRDDLHDESFAIPEERKFPIHDRSHAANALARASGTKYEARVRAAVHKRYPDMGKEDAKK